VNQGRYRAVMRVPGVGWLLTTSLVARLPVAMANLAIILRIATATGSYARAGAVTGAYVVGTGLFGPFLGRVADRAGRRPVLLVAAVVNAAGLISLAFIPVHETLVILIVAAVSGASLPPVAPAVRSLWPALVPEDLRSGIYAFDATMQEATFMVGPTLVALLSSLSGPPAALIACGVIGLVGTVAVSLHPAIGTPLTADPSATTGLAPAQDVGPGHSHPAPSPAPTVHPAPRPARRRLLHPAGLPGLGSLVIIVLVFLASILIVEVTVVAFAGHHHASGQAGLLLAAWSTGSMVGGFAFGARSAHAGTRVLAPLMLAAAVGFLCLAAAPGVGLLYGLLFLAGMSIAPGFSCIYGLVGQLAPSTGSVEAFSWIASGIQMGAACGAALGGLLVEDIGTRWSFVFAAGCGLGTAGIAWWRARHPQSA
jgi:MFS family permease